jgi:hypothetical protein
LLRLRFDPEKVVAEHSSSSSSIEIVLGVRPVQLGRRRTGGPVSRGGRSGSLEGK